MDEFDGNNPFNQHQWKQFEQYFGEKFPFSADKLSDLSWVEPYVQNMLSKSMAMSSFHKNQDSLIKYETFETVTHVIVKWSISRKERARNARVFSARHHVRLTSGPTQQIVPLPAPVIPQSGKAIYKDGVLQLYLRKDKHADPLHEVTVRFSK